MLLGVDTTAPGFLRLIGQVSLSPFIATQILRYLINTTFYCMGNSLAKTRPAELYKSPPVRLERLSISLKSTPRSPIDHSLPPFQNMKLLSTISVLCVASGLASAAAVSSASSTTKAPTSTTSTTASATATAGGQCGELRNLGFLTCQI